MTSPDSSTVEVDTSSSPILKDVNPLIAEVYPLPTKLKVTLSEDNVQHLDWKYLIKKSGKGPTRELTHIGKILKVTIDCNNITDLIANTYVVILSNNLLYQ